MTRYLNPKTDLVLKRIFGQHPNILKSFLNATLPLPEWAFPKYKLFPSVASVSKQAVYPKVKEKEGQADTASIK